MPPIGRACRHTTAGPRRRVAQHHDGPMASSRQPCGSTGCGLSGWGRPTVARKAMSLACCRQAKLDARSTLCFLAKAHPAGLVRPHSMPVVVLLVRTPSSSSSSVQMTCGMPRVVGDRLDLHPRGGRGNGNGVALAQVGPDDVACFRADGAGDLGGEDPLPELGDLIDRAALRPAKADLAHDLRVTPEHAAVDRGDEGLANSRGPTSPRREAIGIQGGGGVAALDDRAVEVEERPTPGPSGDALDLGDQPAAVISMGSPVVGDASESGDAPTTVPPLSGASRTAYVPYAGSAGDDVQGQVGGTSACRRTVALCVPVALMGWGPPPCVGRGPDRPRP